MNSRARHAGCPRIAVTLVVSAASAMLLAGCLIIPVNYHATGSRHNVRSETTNTIHLNVTSREEVLLTLGEPDYASDDGRRFGYLWTKVKAVWIVASYAGSGAGGEIAKSYLLEASFDSSNRLSNVRMLRKWGNSLGGSRELEGVR